MRAEPLHGDFQQFQVVVAGDIRLAGVHTGDCRKIVGQQIAAEAVEVIQGRKHQAGFTWGQGPGPVAILF